MIHVLLRKSPAPPFSQMFKPAQNAIIPKFLADVSSKTINKVSDALPTTMKKLKRNVDESVIGKFHAASDKMAENLVAGKRSSKEEIDKHSSAALGIAGSMAGVLSRTSLPKVPPEAPSSIRLLSAEEALRPPIPWGIGGKNPPKPVTPKPTEVALKEPIAGRGSEPVDLTAKTVKPKPGEIARSADATAPKAPIESIQSQLSQEELAHVGQRALKHGVGSGYPFGKPLQPTQNVNIDELRNQLHAAGKVAIAKKTKP